VAQVAAGYGGGRGGWGSAVGASGVGRQGAAPASGVGYGRSCVSAAGRGYHVADYLFGGRDRAGRPGECYGRECIGCCGRVWLHCWIEGLIQSYYYYYIMITILYVI
jgi:hypothetical protein